MATDKRISELIAASAFTGVEKFEIVQGGLNLAGTPEQMKTYIGGITREFDRAFSAELLFDKNEIAYSLHEISANLTYSIAPTGHLQNQFSAVVQRITTDGTFTVSFSGFTHVLGDIQSGNIPEAGTYLVTFLYYNGVSIANWTKPSSEVSNLTLLSAPANFAAAANGETAIDLTWTNVTNNSGYQVYFSLTGGTGGWTSLAILAADVVTYTHSGLSAGDQRFYRIKALGDQITYQDSNFSFADETIPAAGDVTAPVPTFLPANGNTTWTVNRSLTITFDEPIQNTNATAVTDANVAALLTLKQTNSGGADIGFTATINPGKTVITITPTTHYGANQLVYLAVVNFEDVNGNEQTTPQAITFTTTAYTFFNGTSNFLRFGDILDTLFAVANINFELEITIQNHSISGPKNLIQKYGSLDSDLTFILYITDNDVNFGYVMTSGATRFIQWANCLDGNEHTLLLTYDGSIDTNDGLDRVALEVDTVTQSKALIGSGMALQDTLQNGTAHLSFGVRVGPSGTPAGTSFYSGEAKDMIIRSNAGATVELNVANLKAGTDSSGNGRNGTWV